LTSHFPPSPSLGGEGLCVSRLLFYHCCRLFQVKHNCIEKKFHITLSQSQSFISHIGEAITPLQCHYNTPFNLISHGTDKSVDNALDSGMGFVPGSLYSNSESRMKSRRLGRSNPLCGRTGPRQSRTGVDVRIILRRRSR
jgi:hypothetical protein